MDSLSRLHIFFVNVDELRAAARRELSLDESVFLVGVCGTVDWRKGVDLFLAVARAVVPGITESRFRFIWIGGPILWNILQPVAA